MKEMSELNRYRFRHSHNFEMGMRQILGDKAYHTSDYAAIPKESKKVMLKATKKLSKRIDEIITMDERLRERLLSDIESLEKEIRSIDKSCNEMDIIGIFFSILSRLLGYDWIDGEIHRTPVYFQTRAQERLNYQYGKTWERGEEELQKIDLILERYGFVKLLKEKGREINEIARVLNISDYAVRQILKSHASERIKELRNQGLNATEIYCNLRDEGLYDDWMNLLTPPL